MRAAGSDAENDTMVAPRLVHIQPSSGWVSLRLGDLWEYRELVYFLVWRDIKVRYKQTALGAGWAVLQPLATMLVFSLFFGRLARMPSDGIPYPLFSLAALVPWTFVANGLSQASASIVTNQHLVTKVYVPRLAIPIATVIAGLLDLAIAGLVLVVVMLWDGRVPDASALWVVPLSLLAVAAALGSGLWLAALNVRYRDVKYVVPFLTQLWLFVTPVAYPTSLLPARWRALYALNPMVGVVEGYRWALFGGAAPTALIASSIVGATLLLLTGAMFFRRVERSFADLV
ncbi:MAG: Transport permease protein [Gemmatimonadetes bacterium]|nr:Transport permease protein [Gemmatimonadota bacterium]